jgi:hypothetical protein
LLSELNEAYPGMVDALVDHEGIGIVCGYEDDGTPVVLGKDGKRNLHSGELVGEDPLVLYAPADPEAYGKASLETRIWQVRRVMDFPHAGDLMVISNVFEDGTVAALEELIGNHGGLGGEQTDAFIFHPSRISVPETRNATDVFHVLNELREQSAIIEEESDTDRAEVIDDEWSLLNLWAGLRDVKTWTSLAIHALVLDRSTYREIVNDRRLTGPALLLGFVFAGISGYFRAVPGQELLGVLETMLIWPVSVLAVYWAGRILTRKGYFTKTLRGLGFAHVAYVLDLLAFIPYMAPLAKFLAVLVSFLATWMAASEAHETRGWRTFVLPLISALIMILIPLVLTAMFAGAVVGLESILERLGLAQP